mmetsp:Transcript_99145/g.289317  ORF Transcript_99145/g.289317 Transcript_99145/m.289317 type:complete len:96 (-) Transcript_99145:587-874(-)
MRKTQAGKPSTVLPCYVEHVAPQERHLEAGTAVDDSGHHSATRDQLTDHLQFLAEEWHWQGCQKQCGAAPEPSQNFLPAHKQTVLSTEPPDTPRG